MPSWNLFNLRRTCRDVTRLVFEGEARSLGWSERLSLRLHWLVCDGCARLRRQNDTLRLALDRWRSYRDK